MGESSTVAREKARHLDFMLNKLASKINRVHLDIYNVRLDIRASGPNLTLCEIPEEVILEILQLVCTYGLTRTHFRSIVEMSLVCKQFRRIVLSSSNLWAGCELTLLMPPRIIDMVVSRSGSKGLLVELKDVSPLPSRKRWMSSLTTLFEHRSRWRELRTTLSDETSQLILAHFPNEELSTLVRLYSPLRTKLSPTPLFRIYQDWMLPSLRVLQDETWLPPPSFACRVPNLIKCYFESTPSRFPELFSFLNAFTQLEELQLTIYDANTMLQSTTLHLPALKTLNLLFKSEFEHGALVEHTLRLFSCPEVKQFSLDLANIGDETSITSGWKRGLPSLHSLCPCLESFSLSLFNFRTWEKMYFIDDVLQNLPRTIENIHLYILSKLLLSHYHDSLPQASKSTHPCLTSLIIEHQDSMDVDKDFFTQVAAQLKLRNIRLKKLSDIRHRKEVKQTRSIFREAGVLYDENVPQ